MTQSDPAFWQIESSLNCPRMSPVVEAVGRGKLCVMGGNHCTCHDRPKCGEIYDIKDKTWKYLDDDFDAFAPYDPFSEVAISVEKDEPTQIVFYSLLKGCIMFFDPTKGTISKLIEDQKDFALRSHSWDPSPEGLGDKAKIRPLVRASNNLNAVFTNDTFYWFTFDMYMYAYHVSAKRWFQSPCLIDQFPSLSSHDHPPPSPILVGLPQDGKFVVFLPEEPEPGLMMMACLKVERNLQSLQVLVELIQPLSLEETDFLPFEGKAIIIVSKFIVSSFVLTISGKKPKSFYVMVQVIIPRI
uniref:Uncharacterized protein LOC104230734 isoform X1 n=1 Tax=Nicotiana sylvestris TaxID=4096 RepID=A0A1U7WX84_NICSY|nr:PREDICTED: uncharacterized protein LOC104230734 isoform X1 [Nicotiana sylvestris]